MHMRAHLCDVCVCVRAYADVYVRLSGEHTRLCIRICSSVLLVRLSLLDFTAKPILGEQIRFSSRNIVSQLFWIIMLAWISISNLKKENTTKSHNLVWERSIKAIYSLFVKAFQNPTPKQPSQHCVVKDHGNQFYLYSCTSAKLQDDRSQNIKNLTHSVH